MYLSVITFRNSLHSLSVNNPSNLEKKYAGKIAITRQNRTLSTIFGWKLKHYSLCLSLLAEYLPSFF